MKYQVAWVLILACHHLAVVSTGNGAQGLCLARESYGDNCCCLEINLVTECCPMQEQESPSKSSKYCVTLLVRVAGDHFLGVFYNYSFTGTKVRLCGLIKFVFKYIYRLMTMTVCLVVCQVVYWI